MKYTQPTFTLPVSQGVSQEEWNRIFGAPESSRGDSENQESSGGPLTHATGSVDSKPRTAPPDSEKPRAEGRSNWTCTCSDCTKVRQSMKRTRTKRRDALTSADKD